MRYNVFYTHCIPLEEDNKVSSIGMVESCHFWHPQSSAKIAFGHFEHYQYFSPDKIHEQLDRQASENRLGQLS